MTTKTIIAGLAIAAGLVLPSTASAKRKPLPFLHKSEVTTTATAYAGTMWTEPGPYTYAYEGQPNVFDGSLDYPKSETGVELSKFHRESKNVMQVDVFRMWTWWEHISGCRYSYFPGCSSWRYEQHAIKSQACLATLSVTKTRAGRFLTEEIYNDNCEE